MSVWKEVVAAVTSAGRGDGDGGGSGGRVASIII